MFALINFAVTQQQLPLFFLSIRKLFYHYFLFHFSLSAALPYRLAKINSGLDWLMPLMAEKTSGAPLPKARSVTPCLVGIKKNRRKRISSLVNNKTLLANNRNETSVSPLNVQQYYQAIEKAWKLPADSGTG